MKLSLQHQLEIRQLLATGQRDQVVQRYREFTGCDLETALVEVDAFASGDATRDELPNDRSVGDGSSSSGSARTLITAIMFFVAILGTGWFRKTPTQYDWAVDVEAPKECPHCSGSVRVFEEAAPAEHLEEDIIEGRYRVVLYRHEAARCEACGKWVQQAGDTEILNSRIGPHLRSTAIY